MHYLSNDKLGLKQKKDKEKTKIRGKSTGNVTTIATHNYAKEM